MTEKRLLVLYCGIFAFAVLVEAKITQLMCSGYDILAEKQTVRTVDISAGRADITDCNLNKITGTEDVLKAFVTDETQLQNIYSYIREADREKFYQRIQQEKQIVVDLATPLQTDAIYTISKRYSPVNIAQHLIGYTDLDGNGLTGIERVYDDFLKSNGEKISVHFNVNGNGDIYGNAYSSISGSGRVLALTIDNSLQRMRESVAKEYIPNGSIIIMESKTGKIKAMASTPVYDANNVADYLDNKNSPLVNKALQSFEPGSVIKPLWAALMLENGINPEEEYYCNGYTTVNGHTYHCANNRVHGPVTMEGALVVSCNCYFIDRYVKEKELLFRQTANQLYFGENIKLCNDFYTSKGDFPSAQRLENQGVLSTVSFGQGDFRLTPVHITAYMNVFANKGIYVNPQIVEGIFDRASHTQTEKIYSFSAKRVFSTETSETIKEMLVSVVEDGAARRAHPTFLSAGGKTGTAQTGKTKENGEEIFTAWFCGFYPRDNPQYTICVSMYDGGESTYSAAPVFKRICDSIYYLKYCDT